MGKVRNYSIGLVILGDDGAAKSVVDFFTTEEDAHEYANDNEVERYFLIPVYGQPDLDIASYQEKMREEAAIKKAFVKKPVKTKPTE